MNMQMFNELLGLFPPKTQYSSILEDEMNAFRASMLGCLLAVVQLACGGSGGASSTQQPPPPPPAPVSSLEIAGTMISPRYYQAATPLLDGRILVTGGMSEVQNGYYSPLDTAEIFDPRTGYSSAIPSMQYPHGAHTATRLPNGKVYLFGGGPGIPWNLPVGPGWVEYFDPKLNSFIPAGTTNCERWFHTATLMQDGRILLAGGIGWSADQCEVFDPATNTTEIVGSLSDTQIGNNYYNRSNMTSHLLMNGKVILIGGLGIIDGTGTQIPTGTWVPVGIVEYYDPATKVCTKSTPLITPRASHTSCLLPDGRILVIGGWGFDGTWRSSLNSTEFYNPNTGTVTPGPHLKYARQDCLASLLPDGRVYVSGGQALQENFWTGQVNPGQVLADEIWDPKSNEFSTVSGSRVYQYMHATALSDDGVFFSFGGLLTSHPIGSGEVSPNVWKYVIK